LFGACADRRQISTDDIPGFDVANIAGVSDDENELARVRHRWDLDSVSDVAWRQHPYLAHLHGAEVIAYGTGLDWPVAASTGDCD
jgi:hypothetical protein